MLSNSFYAIASFVIALMMNRKKEGKMFTGIVETVGQVVNLLEQGGVLTMTLQAAEIASQVKIGDSVAVNGVCLTVVDFNSQEFLVQLVPETLNRTNLGELKLHDEVNLETAAKPTTALGGHFVQGHIDTTTEIISIDAQGDAELITFKTPKAYSQYLVNKGYITIDGMSLTIIEANDDCFTITLIPHTKAVTVSQHYQPGISVNIEVDILAKYTEKLLEVRSHV